MSAGGEGRRRRAAGLLAGAALAGALGARPALAVEEVEGKVELSTVDLERLLDLPIGSVSRREERSSDAPGAVFVLTAEDLRAQGARTLAEALRAVPGLFVYEDGHWPTVGVRGVGLLADYGTRVLFLVDGHPVGDVLGIGRSHIGRDLPIPLAAVRQVEVIKGPVGAIYGPTAFLGVVNVVTRAPGKGADGEAVHGEAAVRAQAGAEGTSGAELDAVVAPGGDWGGAVAHASVFGTRGQDGWFPEWSLDRARTLPPGNVAAGVDTASAANGYLRVSALGLDGAGACGWFTRRLPSAPYESLVADRRTHLATTTCFAGLSLDRRAGEGWLVGASASFDAFEYRDAYAYDAPPDGFGVFRDAAFDRFVTGELRARWSAPSGAAHLGLGARGAHHWTLQHAYSDSLPSLLQDPGGVGLGPIRKDLRTLDAWLLGDVAVAGALRLHAGATFTHNELFGDRLTSKGAAVWRPTPATVVKAVYAEGFRAPTVAEAFYEDGTDFLANPGLRPELAQSVEVILERRVGELGGVSVSAFWNRFHDLIVFQTVRLPQGGGLRQQAVNAGTRTVRGLELTGTVRAGPWLQGFGGVSLQRTAPDDAANAPALVASAALSTRWPWRPLRLAVHGAGTSRRDKDRTALLAGQRAVLPGYVVLGAAATLEVPAVRGLSIEASVSNLLDERVLHPVAGDFAPISELPEAGRTIWVGARWWR